MTGAVQVKRSRFVFVRFENRQLVDLARILRGEVAVRHRSTAVVIALAALGRRSDVDTAALSLLATVPEDRWVLRDSLHSEDPNGELTELLVDAGALLSDAPDDAARRALAIEVALEGAGWHPISALLHFAGREGADAVSSSRDRRPFSAIVETSADQYAGLIARHGTPPAHFFEREDRIATTALPPPPTDRKLDRLLRQRQTVRAFDLAHTLDLVRLSRLLSVVFGCSGLSRLAESVTVLQRSSPSAGSLHPIEPYVLIRDVAGLQPGIYHYAAARHALDLLRQLDPDEVGALAVTLLADQSYAREAHALVVLVARVARNAWKYRQNVRMPTVLAMDAGHLSQTFYLVCTDLGLGCFFSAALNVPAVEDALGLDPVRETAIGILGCGVARAGASLRLEREPFVPRP